MFYYMMLYAIQGEAAKRQLIRQLNDGGGGNQSDRLDAGEDTIRQIMVIGRGRFKIAAI